MSSSARRPRFLSAARSGFTLVELLVVIGIIGLLISILLPSLNRARDLARTVACLSNLRQLGQAATMYSSQNNGILIPAGYTLATDVSKNLDMWPIILIDGKYLPQTELHDHNSATIGYRSVFACPAGLYDRIAVNANPTSLFDGDASRPQRWWGNNALPATEVVDLWYGINACTGDYTTLSQLPIRRYPSDSDVTDHRMSRVNNVRKPSETAFLFDGMYMNIRSDIFRVVARHDKLRKTNILYFDGHAGTMDRKEMPGLGGTADGNKYFKQLTSANLDKDYPTPKWRLDQ